MPRIQACEGSTKPKLQPAAGSSSAAFLLATLLLPIYNGSKDLKSDGYGFRGGEHLSREDHPTKDYRNISC